MKAPFDRIDIVVGDITQLKRDALVTAANVALTGGGGVDGAIHRVAGPELVVASQALAPCPTGSAKMTRAYGLNARFVIHAVGPVFHDIKTDGPLLASAYRSSLTLAHGNNLASIAFPCISTGVYGFPAETACQIALDTVIPWLTQHDRPQQVTFCCFCEEDAQRYRDALDTLAADTRD